MYIDYSDLGMELKQHLDSDEKLIWTGIPKQGIIVKGSDALMIPFSLLWGGFALFWEFTAINSGAPFFFLIWGIPFVLIGLYLIFGRFFYDSSLRKNTMYGITQNRIIIKSGVFKQSIKSLNIRTLTDITLNEKPDGSGTIVLGSEMRGYGMFRGTGWPGAGNKMVPTLELIPEARKVYRQIIDLQKEK
jgi:Bacterial membrane flanked domain.